MEMAAIVKHDIPGLGVIPHVVGKERLCEILVVQLSLRFSLDQRPGGVHDLAGRRGHGPVRARFQVGLFHDFVGNFLDTLLPISNESCIPVSPTRRVSLLRYCNLLFLLFFF
jgi:hypothetical protein